MLEYDGTQFVNGPDPEVGSDFKLIALQRIEEYAKLRLDMFVAALNYSAAEMASWPLMLAEVRAYYISGNPADAPMCAAEAAVAGIPLSTLLSKVSGNALAYSSFLAAVKGTRTRHKLVVQEGSQGDALAYGWNEGWPE